ncbi:MAG: hypothetical protein ACYTFW_16055 [Planctomycetota bacterium]|jgi:hypothetical protein
MRKFFMVVPLLVMIGFFTGCKSYWYQEGKTFEECKRDLQQCRSEMRKYSDKSLNLGVYDIRFEKDCMSRRGYRLVKENKLPLRVRRQGPGDGSYGGYYGVAGLLEER